MTDAEIGMRVRALAGDRVDPASVDCSICHVTAGERCVETQTAGPGTDRGYHSTRVISARLTAEGAAHRLLIDLGQGGS